MATEQPKTPEATLLVASALVFYAVMTAIGLALLQFGDEPTWIVLFGDGENVPRDAIVGAACGLVVVGCTHLVRGWEPVARLTGEMRNMLGKPGTGAITILAISSAVGEEILFRGGLQPLLGYLLTALLFGLVHGGTGPRYRAWVVFAVLAGFLLGGLAHFTENLLAPILCHLTINYFNLHIIAAPEAP